MEKHTNHFHIAVAHGVNSSLVLSAHRSIVGCKLVDGEWLFAVENPLHAAHWEDLSATWGRRIRESNSGAQRGGGQVLAV